MPTFAPAAGVDAVARARSGECGAGIQRRSTDGEDSSKGHGRPDRSDFSYGKTRKAPRFVVKKQQALFFGNASASTIWRDIRVITEGGGSEKMHLNCAALRFRASWCGGVSSIKGFQT